MSVTTDRTSSAQTVSPADTTQQSVTTSSTPGRGRRRTPWLALLVAGLTVLTVAVVVTWTFPRQSSAPVESDWTTAYGPGSALYAEQVPIAAVPWTASYAEGSATYGEQVPAQAKSWTGAYGPGSSTYAEQVPAAGRDDLGWTRVYGPGSSTYTQQVPAAGRDGLPWTPAYAPGSTVYGEQVPQG